MSAAKAIAAFLAWLVAALFLVSLISIYTFDYYEGALGSRADNLLLSTLINAAIALVIAIGFAVVLLWRRSPGSCFSALPVMLSAAVACGLVYAFALVGIVLSERFESWQLNLVVFTLYSVTVGAGIGAALKRFSKARHHAA